MRHCLIQKEYQQAMRNYATQMDAAKRGIVTPEIETVAKKENRPVEFIMERVAKGTIAIPANINHKSLSAEAVGDGTRVKINVNLGISGDCKDYEMELRKVRMAVDMGAESIMDLSNYGKTNTFRKQLIDMSPAMIGTVPMYDAIGYLEKDLLEITAQDFLKVVEAHAREGVDFMTIHAGINRRAVEAFMREGRRMNIVSRGGSLLFAWMKMTGNENPFFEYYDEVLDILRRYDVTISLGDALRPGCIDDASDAGQISELIELGNLAQRAWAKDVQVMIEGPGHMAMNEIAANMQMEKRLCHGAPFYVLGPLVTDIAPGYDHITSAIGGAIAAQAGANFLCYVTPAEHLRLPDENDVREGIVASKIAAELNIDLSDYEIINEPDKVQASLKAVKLAHDGVANMYMKGLLDTKTFLKSVLDKEVGLRTGNTLSHVAVFEVKGIEQLLFLTDVAFMTYPTLEDKVHIIENTVAVAHACGVECPKVAPLAAVEVVNPKMPCTVDADELRKMNAEGKITGCVVDGPLSMDIAIDPEAAHHKGAQDRPAAGHADILLFPDIQAGNLVYKTLVHTADCKNGCILTGTKVPAILTSRSDSFQTKVNSIALAAVVAAGLDQ